jgi:hypothetical protein
MNHAMNNTMDDTMEDTVDETPVSDEQRISQLNEAAVLMLERKLLSISARVFHAGRKPTIAEIYENAAAAHNILIDDHCRIDLLFREFNTFAKAEFQARKTGQSIHVSTTIFLWQMDDMHSFSVMSSTIRWNVLLAVIVLNAPGAAENLSEPLRDFLNGLVDAWIYSAGRFVWNFDEEDGQDPRWVFINQHWREGKYDFIHWGGRYRARMTAAVRALEKRIPPSTFPIKDFWNVS